MNRVDARAFARAGVLGNPSDQYEGKAIALSVFDFAARVTLERAEHFSIAAGPGGARPLLRAAIRRFSDHLETRGRLPADDPRLRFSARFSTTIPRQVGLAGSSAIIIAALRALARWFDVEIHPAELAELALAAEVEDLGIAAGPMDRVIQAYEGLMHMDFRSPRSAASYTRLDPGLLPPLFVAWDAEVPGESSGRIHSDVRSRWLRGDLQVRRAMARFPRIVDEGLACLERRDVPGFQKLVNQNFDVRASLFELRERDLEMVRIGRALGAAVKFCGSGGAVLGVMRQDEEFPAIRDAYAEAGFPVIRPKLAPDLERAPGA